MADCGEGKGLWSVFFGGWLGGVVDSDERRLIGCGKMELGAVLFFLNGRAFVR